MSRSAQALAWIAAGAVLGFFLSAVFSGSLHLDRNVFLFPYVAAVTAFVAAHLHWKGIKATAAVRDRALPGLIAGVLVGALMIANVWSLPPSPAPTGKALAVALLWPGLVYGLADAVLLSVVPVLALSEITRFRAAQGRVVAVVGAVVASAVVTAAYHLGYEEFQGAALAAPLIGNTLLTLSYVVSRSPLAPIVGHVAMHLAVVLHGMENAVQLPPH